MARPKERTTVCESALISLSFNGDATRAAFSPNNHLVYIVDCGPKPNDCVSWVHTHTLDQHDQYVAGVEWHPKTNVILTCSHDRRAFVWAEQPLKAGESGTAVSADRPAPSTKWVPTLVVMDAVIKRGLTCGRWSADGLKVYIGCVASNIAIGNYTSDDDWWVCRGIDSHRSAVTCLAAHPTNNTILASGSTDSTVMLHSTYLKSVDGKNVEQQKFGSLLAEVPLKAWVLDIAWGEANGDRLVVTTQDSRVHVIHFTNSVARPADFAVQTVSLGTLPLKHVQFLPAAIAADDTAFVAAGFDFYPMLFRRKGDSWALEGRWTAESAAKKTKTDAELAREKFQNQSALGQNEAVDLPKTKHTNTITGVQIMPAVFVGGKVKSSVGGKDLVFTTSSMDGRVEYWDMESVVSVA